MPCDGWWLEDWPANWPGRFSDEWVVCWRCELDVRCRGYVEPTAYGPCCHRCLVEMPRDERFVLGLMGRLTEELLGARG